MLTIPSEVKALFSSDTVHKNFHVRFPDGEYTDLNNEDIISESVQFTESLCSQQYFKFGLAEASQLEFTAVGIPNVRGAYIECAIEIDCTRLGSAWAAAHPVDSSLPFLTPQSCEYANKLYYRIPYGRFRVDTCPRDHGQMWQRQITAYSDTVHSNDSMCKVEAAKQSTPTYNWIKYNINLAMFVYSNIYEHNPARIVDAGYTASAPYTPATARAVRGAGIVFDTINKNDNLDYEITVIPDGIGFTLQPAAETTSELLFRVQIEPTESQDQLKDNLLAFMEDYDIVVDGNVLTEAEKAKFLEEKVCSCILPKLHFTDYDWEFRTTIRSTAILTDSLDGGVILDSDSIIYPQKLSQEKMTAFVSKVSFIQINTTHSGSTTTAFIYGDSYEDPVFTMYTKPNDVLHDLVVSSNNTLKQNYGKQKYYSHYNSLTYTGLLQGFLEIIGAFLKPNRSGTLDFFQMADNPTPIAVSASDWSSFWWDETPIDSIGLVNVIYTQDGEEQQQSFNIGDGNSVYTIENNEVLKSAELDEATMQSILTTYFEPNASVINFTPVELEMRGLPYLESGDYIELTAEDGETVQTYILNQTISGIQNLRASVTSTTGALLEVVDNE